MKISNLFLVTALSTSLIATTAWAQRSESFGQTVKNNNITEAEVQAAQ